MRLSLFFIILIITLPGCDKTVEDEPENDCQAFEFSDTYQYPLVPGTDEWKSYEGNRKEACIIPEDVLATISTEGLLESLLNKPFMVTDYYAYDNRQDGFNHLKELFPGIGEFLSRPDVFSVIYDRYQKMDLDCTAYYPPGYTDVVHLAFPCLEIYMFQDEFLEELDSIDIHLLFETVREINILKIDKRPLFQMEALESTALMGKILLRANYSPFVDYYNSNEFIPFFLEKLPSFGWEISPRDTINAYAEAYYSLLH